MLKIGSIVRLPELPEDMDLHPEIYLQHEKDMKAQYGLIGTVVEVPTHEESLFRKRKWSRVKIAFQPDEREWIWCDKDLTILKEKKQ